MKGLSILLLAAAPLACAHRAPNTPAPSAGERYFYYSSDEELPVERARSLAPGSVVGIEYNTDDRDRKIREYHQLGMLVHVYLEGPGGATGDGEKLEKDECERIKRNAREVEIPAEGDQNDCHNKGGWQDAWRSWGYLKYLKVQLRAMASLPVYSVEVDNLENGGFGPGNLVNFIEKFKEKRRESGSSARLLLKNPTPQDLQETMTKYRSDNLIAQVAISEEFWKKDWCELRKGAANHELWMAFSWKTEKYHAEVSEKGVDRVMGGPEQPKRKKGFACP